MLGRSLSKERYTGHFVLHFLTFKWTYWLNSSTIPKISLCVLGGQFVVKDEEMRNDKKLLDSQLNLELLRLSNDHAVVHKCLLI